MPHSATATFSPFRTHLHPELKGRVDEADDLLHVGDGEAAGGEGRCAQPDTARVHGRLVPGHRVLVVPTLPHK